MTAVEPLSPTNEAARLAAVRRYDILDTPPDGVFDRITALAARAFNVPYSVISVVDTDRIWFKSQQGLGELTEIDREPGLCASAILGRKAWVITDGATDPRALANPLVAGELGLRFYAGVPLGTRDGHNLGTLCVLGHEPRLVTEHETTLLEDCCAISTRCCWPTGTRTTTSARRCSAASNSTSAARGSPSPPAAIRSRSWSASPGW